MAQITEWTTHSEEETAQLGYKLGKKLAGGAILSISGELGAGKTTLIRGVAQAVTERPCQKANSPTFSYLQIYEGTAALYHFDLWRLNGPEDFIGMGFEDYLFAGGVCCIEWGERIEELLPPHTQCLQLNYGTTQKERMICWKESA